MRFDVITLFPDMFTGPLAASILKRAQDQGLLEVHLHDPREWATDKHRTVDDTPYGGGAGMLLKVDILHAAIAAVEKEVADIPRERRRVLLLAAQGKRFRQSLARYAARKYDQITLICGHYEGVDDRIRTYLDGEVSIGDFVLTGGELPAMLIIDAIARLLPEVIRKESPEEESFSIRDVTAQYLLEYPQYTRPLEFEGERVPDILLSGNHQAIATWRLEQARARTKERQKDTDETL